MSKLRTFTIAFVSLAGTLAPADLLSCGGGYAEPEYAFLNFFRPQNGGLSYLQPFYYTPFDYYYSGPEEDDHKLHDLMIKEWRSYLNNKPNPSPLSTSLFNDSSHTFLLRECQTLAKTEAVKYLQDLGSSARLFGNEWTGNNIPQGKQTEFYLKSELAKDPFVRDRYRLLAIRFAFHLQQYQQARDWCNKFFPKLERTSLSQMAWSYKAGALYRLEDSKQAAYIYSRLFDQDILRNYDVLQGFRWTTNDFDPILQANYLKSCNNEHERAAMLTMFSLHGLQYNLTNLREIDKIDPSGKYIKFITTREINKLESNLLTRYYLPKDESAEWEYYYTGTGSNADRDQLRFMTAFLKTKASGSKPDAFYITAFSYLQMMQKNFDLADSSLQAAGRIAKGRLADQVRLQRMILLINRNPVITRELEARLLPDLQWLEAKEKDEVMYHHFTDFMEQVLAPKYDHQQDRNRLILVMGARSDGSALTFLQREMSTAQLNTFYQFTSQVKPSPYDAFLIKQSKVGKKDAVEILGVSYLRDLNYSKAISWLEKISEKQATKIDSWEDGDAMNVDPFYDYVNDYERYDKTVSTPYTRLRLAKEMLSLQKKIAATADRETRAKLCYRYASGLYNMSFYGNAWKTVDFWRSSRDWNTGDFTPAWKHEYYRVVSAEKYYQMAHDLSKNKEFKAASFFLVLKCRQRQIAMPGYEGWMSSDESSHYKAFYQSPLFPEFKKQYGDTKYYKYVFDRCSYLRDFEAGK